MNAHVHVSDLDLPVKMQMRYDQRHEDKRSKWRFEWLAAWADSSLGFKTNFKGHILTQLLQLPTLVKTESRTLDPPTLRCEDSP